MTFTIELTPEESRRVEVAQAQGVDVSTLIRRVIDTLPAETPAAPVLTEKQKAAIALLDSWRAEDATEDPAELERRETALQTLAASLNANRAAEGRAPVFP